MVKIRIIDFDNRYAIVERDGAKYRVSIEVVIFGENPAWGYIDKRELTAARRIS